MTRNERNKRLRELEQRAYEAVKPVSADEGADPHTRADMNLAEVRELVQVMWAAMQHAERLERITRAAEDHANYLARELREADASADEKGGDDVG